MLLSGLVLMQLSECEKYRQMIQEDEKVGVQALHG